MADEAPSDDRLLPSTFYQAAEDGSYEVVIHLLESGVNVHFVDKRHLLRELLYSYDSHDNTGRRGVLLQCIVKIIDAGVDVNTVNIEKEAIIVTAARKGLYEAVLYMLEHGFNIRNVVEGRHNNLVNRHMLGNFSFDVWPNNNLLHILLNSYNKHDRHTGRRDLLLQCLVKVVDAGVDVNQLNAVEETPICRAARKGLYEAVLYMLEHGFNKHYVDERQNNLLHIVLDSYNNHGNTGRRDLLLQCILKIIDGGVDVNTVNAEKEYLIQKAARKGLYEVVLYMLKRGKIKRGHPNKLLRELLDSYEYDSHDNTSRRDLLLQCLVKVVDDGVDVNQLNVEKEAVIETAARKGLYEAVIHMLEHGFNISHFNGGHHNNLLHKLLDSYDSHDNTSRRDLLLQCLVKVVDAGVDVNQLNAVKEAIIVTAARKGLYEAVIYLLEHGFDKHYVDERQNNLLHIVLDSYNNSDNTGRRDLLMQVVVKLVEAGVDVNQSGEHKYTPILIAAGETLYDVGIYLLEHGVDAHYVDVFKCNILHYVLCIRVRQTKRNVHSSLIL